MNNALTILDDFFPEYEAIRAFALTHDFDQAPEYDGHTYPGFAPVKDPRFGEYLAGLLSEVTGCRVGIRMACFTAGRESFETVQWIHADTLCSSHAGVVYLFDRPGFGTAFWRHRELGEDSLTTASRECLNAEALAARLQHDGQTDAAWQRTDYADSRKNRLIFYPADRFHSRYPQQAFGDAPDNCRLTLAIFFDILP